MGFHPQVVDFPHYAASARFNSAFKQAKAQLRNVFDAWGLLS
jgi:hypothetical protein